MEAIRTYGEICNCLTTKQTAFRVVIKQLFMCGTSDVCQIDGVNEIQAVTLMAK